MHENNIIVLNTGEGTRLNPENGDMKAIDLTFATPELASNCQWEVRNQFLGSDHAIVLTTIDFEPIEGEITFRPKFKFDKADWATYAQHTM